MLEKNGVGIAAVSYDSQQILKGFADKQGIGFPLLSDRDSAVIRRFGILNTNIAPGLRAHGVPHPVDYLVSQDGMLVRKYFVANYQHRVTGSSVVLREFGVIGEDAPLITLRSGALTVEIALSGAKAFAGQEISYRAKFKLEPGWHVYGTPTSDMYSATSITFDDPKIARQSFKLPELQTMESQAYGGSFQVLGSLLLKFPTDAGKTVLSGQLSFQQCSDTVCEAPETITFELPLTIEPFMDAERKK
jgi:AhpC/TSA family/Disulphide bond corrector protein DsbC